MKKILLALLLTAGLYAGETIYEVDDGLVYTKVDATGFVGYDYYVGALGSINQTSKRMSEMSFLGQGGNEFTNAGLGLNAAVKLIEYDNVDTYIEARVLKSFFMEESEYIDTESWGIYLKPKFTIFEHVNLYGLLGVAHVTYTATKSGADFSGSGVSGGIGVEIDGREDIGFTVDYVVTGDSVNLSILGGESIHSAITVGVIYRFD